MISLIIEFLASIFVSIVLFIKIFQEKRKDEKDKDKKKILIFRVISYGLLAIAVISALQIYYSFFSE